MRTLALALLLATPALTYAQTASNMAPPAGNTGAANNGAGTTGSLARPRGSHGSTQQSIGGVAAMGDRTSHPQPAQTGTAPGDNKLEKDPTQGAAGQPSAPASPTNGTAPAQSR